MKLEITADEKAIGNLFGDSRKASPGKTFDLPGAKGCTVVSGGGNQLTSSEMIMFVLGSGWSLGISMLAAYLYDKLKGDQTATLLINDKPVEISEVEITIALEREVPQEIDD